MLLSKSKKVIYYLQKKILTLFGDIEIHKFPFFFIYNPVHYKLKGKHFRVGASKIKPFDVLLRRYDKYLDNGFIPGYWNHAGIYTSKGTVLHAVAEGVIEEELFDFYKADHLCILRPQFQFSKAAVNQKLKDMRGKEYDFSFDFNNGDRLSCTEVIKEAFTGYDSQIPISTLKLCFLTREIVIPDTIYRANFEVIYDTTKEDICDVEESTGT